MRNIINKNQPLSGYMAILHFQCIPLIEHHQYKINFLLQQPSRQSGLRRNHSLDFPNDFPAERVHYHLDCLILPRAPAHSTRVSLSPQISIRRIGHQLSIFKRILASQDHRASHSQQKDVLHLQSFHSKPRYSLSGKGMPVDEVVGRTEETFPAHLCYSYTVSPSFHCELFQMRIERVVSGFLKEIRFSRVPTRAIPNTFDDVLVRVLLFMGLVVLSGGPRLNIKLSGLLFGRVDGVRRRGMAQFRQAFLGVETRKQVGRGLFGILDVVY